MTASKGKAWTRRSDTAISPIAAVTYYTGRQLACGTGARHRRAAGRKSSTITRIAHPTTGWTFFAAAGRSDARQRKRFTYLRQIRCEANKALATMIFSKAINYIALGKVI
ncbi:unnamed protein product, partial [Iphiclides podalirius]